MKKSTKTIKLSEKFDQQLLNILSEELKALRNAKNELIKSFNPDSDKGLLVA